ncbi:ATP-binding cassette sub-family G member 1 [Cyphomyrmex costatus]|uniref:ATP-binding cassette sub-family G member 1 n=1 Tax=Cyphomyrmex costatus TaxID=456900 RepID=A0A195D0X8_9HYME|nr:ATP-binding cassette sub-family G member 1 [Cyphomyrmex costatus]
MYLLQHDWMMADLKNLTLSGGGASRYSGDEQVQFIPGGSHQVTIRSPPLSLHLESLNNAVHGGSQNNLHCSCNGATSNGAAAAVCTGGVLARKVPNHSGASPSQSKRPAVSLTHLPKRPPVDVEFKNLAYSVSEGRKRGYKTILKCVNGKFRSGELTAIMGPSGAGKSTLMNVLAGYKTSHLSGSVLINGKDRNLRTFRKMSCYIMQDDRLLPHLTVYEAMTVSANLKLGKDISATSKKVVIEEIIETLGLREASNTQTQSLSGGQRKRLSIALELVNNPPVMFFDEPTSGLDSSACFQCLSLLKSLSRGGRTIICTIHQPSARLFEMFDHLYLLAEGQCIYQGNVGGLVPFLSSMGLDCPSYHNPADYVMEVACGEHGECVHKLVMAVNNGKCNNYQLHQAGTTVINMPVSCTTSLLDSAESIEQKVGFPTNGWMQFWILLKRTFMSQIRDLTLTKVRLISHIIVGFLIGAIYYDIGNEASEVMIPMEMSVFVREHLNYWYSVKAFYLARTLADLPFQMMYSIAYVMIVYFITSQPLEAERFLMYLNICILTSLVAQSIGLLIGAAMSVESGVFIGPVMSVPIILFSGFFVNFNAVPKYLKFLSYVSYVRYGFEGAMISVYGYNRAKLKCSEYYCHFKSPTKFLEQMAMENAVYWVDVVALLGFLLVLRVAVYFVLKLKLRSLR